MSEKHLQDLRGRCDKLEDNQDKIMLENRELDQRVEKLEDKDE